jgi:uncharacterized membrane protein YphA (DoxX/SURF4 family)
MKNFVASSNRSLSDARRPDLARRWLLWSWPYRVVRFAIAIIFLWSGLTKVFDPSGFAGIIQAFGLIPETMVMPVAVVLPLLELLAGVGLLLDVSGSLSLVSGLLLLFVSTLVYGIGLGLDVDCGCFGPEDPEAAAFRGLRTALYRDLFIMAGIAYLYWWRYRMSSKPVRLINLM